MYSNFLYDDKDAFSDLFVDISEEEQSTTEVTDEKHSEGTSVFGGIKSIFSGMKNGGMLTTLLLFYMLSDCDEDERLIILALYFLMGI